MFLMSWSVGGVLDRWEFGRRVCLVAFLWICMIPNLAMPNVCEILDVMILSVLVRMSSSSCGIARVAKVFVSSDHRNFRGRTLYYLFGIPLWDKRQICAHHP